MNTERINLTDLSDLDAEDWLDDEGSWEEPAESQSEPPRGQSDQDDRNQKARRVRTGRRGQSDRTGESDSTDVVPNRKSRAGKRGAAQNAERARRQPAGQTSALTDLLLLVFKIGLIVVFLLVLFTFFYGITQVRDTSMEPAVKEGDLVIYYRSDKAYTAGDAIVVEYSGQLQVRRVVAVAGDTVDISENGGLIINGSTQIEADIYTQTLPYTEGITFPVTVGEGEVFVLGDNRESATDSRIYGTVAISATKGSVMTVIRRRGI